MPDPAPHKRRPVLLDAVGAAADDANSNYAELRCRTNFSFLEGASHPDELVNHAAELGLAALAITDRNSVAGVVRAHVAAKSAGLKLIVGAEITPTDGSPLLLWAMNRAGYANLCRLITRGRRSAPKGECHLTVADVVEHASHLLAGLTTQLQLPSSIRDAFRDRLYVTAQSHLGPADSQQLHRTITFASRENLPLVAVNDVHYHTAHRQPLQDVLTAIRLGRTVADLGEHRFPNAERHLKSAAAMRSLFASAPQAVARTLEVANRCSFSLDELRYEYPAELCPAGMTLAEHLTKLTWQGARQRYPRGVPEKVRRLIEHELRLIDELNYAAYFLTVWDLVRFARSRGILCQGRGSAANSAVCFCLGVTSVDPERIDVLFERFISKERNEAPDIDVDFEHERREEVIQYLYEKYGRERAGMTATVISYRPRSAIRDVGKALGLSLDRVETLAKHVDHLHDREKLEQRFAEAGLPASSRLAKQLISLVMEILEFPRHLSQHVGGMVLTNGPLHELVPIENATMPGRTVIEWDKDDLDSLGLLKVDVLALGMLSAIRRCFALVEKHHDQRLTLANIPAYDRRVFDMIGRADTIGVFQIESRAQMAMLPRLRPRCFYDLVIEVAIVRPGPIQGDMVHPYLRRRCGEEPVEFPDERIREVLEKTLGVPIFQEQAMRLAIVAAGFTPGQADQLRRAMGAWRKRGIIDQFQQKLTDGMTANGYSTEFAARVFQMIRGFGEYGFPESHAASFALLVWASAWLKHHYPAAFTAALLNSQPMGFYAPAQLVADVRKHHVTVLPVDVNASDWDCSLETPATSNGDFVTPSHPKENTPHSATALRLGFRMIAGFSSADAQRIAAVRAIRPFVSMEDFAQRTGFSAALLTRLSRADAFRSLQRERRPALWDALSARDAAPLFDSPATSSSNHVSRSCQEEENVELPPLAPWEETVADYRTTGLSLRAHPISFLRPTLQQRRVTPAARLAALRENQFVRVAGLVLLRQRPGSASGVTFVTLEDETGFVNLIVYPQVWERHHVAARAATLLMAHGTLQRQGDTVHVIVGRLQDLSAELADVEVQSRDFR